MLQINFKVLVRVVMLALFVAALTAQNASANPILWSLVGVTFNDGGSASGSFVYDADTNTYSNISITTTAGSAFGGATYTLINNTNGPSASGMYLLTSLPATTGMPGLLMGFLALTNAGGTIPHSFFGVTEGTVSTLPQGLDEKRSNLEVGEGSLMGVPEPVPEPSSFVLSIVPLGALAFFAQKHRNRTS